MPAFLQLTFRIHLNSPVLQLTWHGGRGTLACVTEDSTVILNESVMHAYMSGDLSVRVCLRMVVVIAGVVVV